MRLISLKEHWKSILDLELLTWRRFGVMLQQMSSWQFWAVAKLPVDPPVFCWGMKNIEDVLILAGYCEWCWFVPTYADLCWCSVMGLIWSILSLFCHISDLFTICCLLKDISFIFDCLQVALCLCCRIIEKMVESNFSVISFSAIVHLTCDHLVQTHTGSKSGDVSEQCQGLVWIISCCFFLVSSIKKMNE